MQTRLLAAVAMLSTGLLAHATTITQLTSPTQLSPSDTAFVDPDPAGTMYPGPSVSFNTTGGRLTFSRGAGNYEAD